MSATTLSSNAFVPCAPSTRLLDVPSMIKPFLDNYDAHVDNFVAFLRDQLNNSHLIYEGPDDVHEHILQKTTYACSVLCKPKKLLKNVFPVMIGSRLDLAIRHRGSKTFTDVPTPPSEPSFQELDMGRGFFVVNGFLRQVPYFFTNDPTNTHVIQKKIVRVYAYDAYDRGKELSYYVSDTKGRRCGQSVIIHNDGTEALEPTRFFDHCPHPTDLTAYMAKLHRDDTFRIDHLANKMVVSPGHLFVKLFVKYLYGPIRERKWTVVKSKAALVSKSIETGCLLHVLSRKTLYFKEGSSAGKMTPVPHESHREIGANGEIFVEKNTGCYREVNSQIFSLNPYVLQLIVRQMSQKVKSSSVSPFDESYTGFLCIMGCFETKNVGRTTMMVRGVSVSTCCALDPVFGGGGSGTNRFWETLNLEPEPSSPYYVVVNEACVPVSQSCFRRVDLLDLKRRFGQIECLQRDDRFIVVRYKAGLVGKRLPTTDVWVTPYDEAYWARRLFGHVSKRQLVDRFGFDYVTSYATDLTPFFRHNSFVKNILALNALKNSVLTTTPRHALYFMDTVSAYVREPTSYHRVLLQPADDRVSEHFVIRVPKLVVAYVSFMGCTQEDCIVRRADVDAFDCCRFYTFRFKLETAGWVQFYPVRGDPDESSGLVGTVVSDEPLIVEPCSIHVRATRASAFVSHLHFAKPPFRVVHHHLTSDRLVVSVEQEHASSTADKLCSFHGQKGVIRVMDAMMTMDDGTRPDLVVNPYGLFRMTPGQILEGLHWGGGRDSTRVYNSDGRLVPGGAAFFAGTFYFSIAYWSGEHMYAPKTCVYDKVTGQAVKGRSRNGGMRLGNMELINVLRGNGLAACFEEKFFEDGDRVPTDENASAIPKSVNLVQEDAKFFKCHLEYRIEPAVQKL